MGYGLARITAASMIMMLALSTISSAQEVRERKVSGSIVAVANGLLQIKSRRADKQEWIVKPQGVSNFQATAGRDWLHPGAIVMVTASFDNQGNATLPVELVQAFTPRRGRAVGLVPDPSNPGDPKDKTVPRGYLLAGPIKSIEDGNLEIAVGRKSFKVPMAEEVEVTIDLINDLSWIKAGDEIECKVKYVQVGQGFASEMKITAKEPLEPRPPAPLTKKQRLAKARREKAEAAAAKNAAAISDEKAEAAEAIEAGAVEE